MSAGGQRPLRVLSWNVNGLRSVVTKGFRAWLGRSRAAIVGLQEVRAREDQLEGDARAFKGWHRHIVSAERPGYSGVALLARRPPSALVTSLLMPRNVQIGWQWCYPILRDGSALMGLALGRRDA